MIKPVFILLISGLAFSCLQTDYEEALLDYIPVAAGDISCSFSAPSGSDMLIVNIYGGSFQENINAGSEYFTLSQGIASVNLNVPLRDSDTRVIFSFDPSELLSGSGYTLTVGKDALKQAVSRVTAQAVNSGIWEIASGTDGIFGRSAIWDIGYGGGKFVAVADDGKMAFSDDGLSWSAIRPGSGGMQSKFTNTIRGIAWGDGKFVAVGYEARMAASDNGISWNGWSESLVGGNSLLCIIYGGGRFVAGGERGKIIYMQDGGNWTGAQDSRFGEKSILALAWGNPNGQDVYVAAGTDGQLSWSNDAVNWTYVASDFGGQHIFGLAWGNGCFVAVGDNGIISRSQNGKEWHVVSNSSFGSSGVQSVSFGSGTFIAVGHDSKMAKSTDGETWTAIEPGGGDSQNKFPPEWQIRSVGYGGGRFLAAGDSYSTEETRIVYSFQAPEVIMAPTDKASAPFNSSAGDNRLIISLTGGKFSASAVIDHFSVLVGGTAGINSGAISGSIVERSDMRIVIKLNNPVVSPGTGQQIKVVAAAFATQPSSVQVLAERPLGWSLVNPSPFGTSNVSAFACNGSGKYIAVGAGKIAVSADGQSWTEITGAEKDKWTGANDYVFFRDIKYADGKFVAVGYWINGGVNNAGWGVAAFSTDGANWTLKDKILTFGGETTSPQVYTIAHNGGAGAGSRFIAAGQWGRTAWSTDGNTWTPVQIGSFNYLNDLGKFENVMSIAYGGGIFVAAGGNGKAAYSDDNGVTWKWAANILLGSGVIIKTICFGDGKFIAAGDGGNMKIVSSDQIAPAGGSVNGGDYWQGTDSKFSTTGILAVAYNPDKNSFIAAGHDGKMSVSSDDGRNWTPISPGTGAEQNLFSYGEEQISCVIWDGEKYIAGGNKYPTNGNTSKLTYSK